MSQNLLSFVNSKRADKPVFLHSLISDFVCGIYYKSNNYYSKPPTEA